MHDDHWVFGYGSLIWRAGFPFADARRASITGFVRRFWQGSPDHRGTPDRPGRVVTLIPASGAVCGGRAYRIEARDREQVMAGLDHREQGGYERAIVTIRLDDGREVTGTTYYATPQNPWYLGDAPLDEMAAHIATCHGPSGTNLDYLQRLHASEPHDTHLDDLIAAVRRHLADDHR